VRFSNTILAALLLIGIVDQIDGDIALVEYRDGGKIAYSQVSLDLSACQPFEGQKVHFFKDYKIVSCIEDKGEE
tara:strand:+ start:8429 stop:8650 length:222 start_codon:yes stop_codon:yes gene_type:complete